MQTAHVTERKHSTYCREYYLFFMPLIPATTYTYTYSGTEEMLYSQSTTVYVKFLTY